MSLLNKIREIPFNRKFASLMLIVMSTQLVFIEGYSVSIVKVGIMGIAAILLLGQGQYVSKAVITGSLYWMVCFFTSIFNVNLRFSTLGYLGMFLVSYMLFYQYVYTGTFTLPQFKRLLRFLILAFCTALIIQQIAVLIGFVNMPLLNLGISHELGYKAYYTWNRLPTLTAEPSHSAVVLTGLMLGYIRCIEIEKGGLNATIKDLFNKENRLPTLSYLYLIVFMGSGTGWIGLGIICLYFIRLKSMLYIVPLLIALFAALQMSSNKQFHRAVAAVYATFTMNPKVIQKADGSGAMRIVPLVNTIKSDYTDKATWFGRGTTQKVTDEDAWIQAYNKKIPTVEQYGLIALIASVIFVYCCCIRNFFSIETLCFIILLLCTIGNVYIIWSMLYIFTATRYLRENRQT
jgi:hypothetical protein